jgi:hypothetical protein
MLIENLRDLAVAMIINQTVDLRDDLRFDLADFGNGERSLKQQRARSTARQPNMSRDALRLDQRYIFDKQTNDAFAFANADALIVPDLRQLLGKIENPSPRLGIERFCLLLAAPFIFFGRFGMES